MKKYLFVTKLWNYK